VCELDPVKARVPSTVTVNVLLHVAPWMVTVWVPDGVPVGTLTEPEKSPV
jgi:hypothetical protein